MKKVLLEREPRDSSRALEDAIEVEHLKKALLERKLREDSAGAIEV